MRAAILREGKIEVGNHPDPVPGSGEVLVRTLRCALCASDLHVVHHGQELVRWSREYGGPFQMDLARPIVLGHEYCAEIVDYGPGTRRALRPGTRVTSMPAVFRPNGGISAIGLSNAYPGGFGEYMLLGEDQVREVPAALSSELAALTEPVSVGMYYVRAARLEHGEVPLVIGCGAIGLAVIAALRRQGTRPIVAADFSAERCALALQMGADLALDPAHSSPYGALPGIFRPASVIFECVGVPGVLDGILRGAAAGARVLVAGWCLEVDHVFTPAAHTKGLTVRFGGGPEPVDFDTALRALGAGEIDVTPWIARTIGLGGVAASLEDMRNPASGLRTLLDPTQP